MGLEKAFVYGGGKVETGTIEVSGSSNESITIPNLRNYKNLVLIVQECRPSFTTNITYLVMIDNVFTTGAYSDDDIKDLSGTKLTAITRDGDVITSTNVKFGGRNPANDSIVNYNYYMW